MKPTPDTRKPIDALTSDDIETYPVWEFATDEEDNEDADETWVRPLICDEIPLGEYALSVAADFVAPSGHKFSGIVDVSTNGQVMSNGGCLIHDRKYTYISADRKSRERRNLLKSVGLLEVEFFPLKYTLRIRVQGELTLRSGELA
jgi:hypothetical protein